MSLIMIVEDDTVIQHALATSLQKWGHAVHVVQQFDTILDEFQKYAPHLVILDITLPLFNGYHWCQEIRKLSNVPILFLSSHSQPMDLVMAINLGADDYITKPFDMSILIAKIQS